MLLIYGIIDSKKRFKNSKSSVYQEGALGPIRNRKTEKIPVDFSIGLQFLFYI